MIFNVGAGGGASTADKVKYDNTESGLQSTDVQGAVDELNSSLTTLSDTVDELTNKNNEIIKVDFPVGTSVQPYPTGCTNTNLIPIGVAIKGSNEQGYFAPSDVSGTFIQTEIDGIHLTRGTYSRDMIAFLVKVS